MNSFASNGRSGLVNNPRHPSLDNVARRSSPNRSHPQPPGDSGGPLDAACSVLFGLMALVCMFGAATLLSILFVTVRPFSKSVYRRLAAQLGEGALLDAVALLLPNTRLYLTGDSDVPSPVGTSILVSNHVLDGDWWAVLMLGRSVGLRGSIKVFLRKELLQITDDREDEDRERPDSSSQQLTPASKSVTFVRNNGRINNGSKIKTSPQLALIGKILHLLLDFPVLSAENNTDYISDREELFQLLRSFAQNNGADAPVHLLLYPESWSLHDGSLGDRKAVLAKSNEFAKREGRPQLKHLLLPRTTGFNASLESLRDSSPVVYDVTMAYRGYDGFLQPPIELSLPTLWRILRRQFPSEIHLRIKRYSMEEVMQDASWLDKQWAEKDRLLNHFARYQSFPTDDRGFCRHRIFDTRHQSVESSVLALVRLLLLPCAVPFLFLLSIPVFWIVVWMWLAQKSYYLLFPDSQGVSSSNADGASGMNNTSHTPGSAGVDSATGTPFFPATPFVSPTSLNWRDMINGDKRR